MKKILFISALFTSALLLGSCNHESDFPGLDEATQIKLVKNYTITYDGTYPTGGAFTYDSPASSKVPAWLYTKYYACDKGSTATVTYQYNSYKALASQSFERTITSGAVTTIAGWQNVAVQGTNQWVDKSYNSNIYTQMTAYKAPGVCESWFISPKATVIDGSVLSFDVCVGSYNADCLKVLISTNYDGTNIASATWTDVTSSFAIPKTPTSGYGTLGTAGSLSLTSYVGKDIYVAFKYLGDGVNAKTTTYQLDNIFVGIPGGIVTKTEQYVFTGQTNKWVFDPTVNLVVSGKGNTDLQTLVSWANVNKPTFVNSYGDSEFYFGASTYNGNFSFDYVTRQTTYGDTELAAVSDEAGKIKLMFGRLPQAFNIILKAKYPNATNMVAGIVVDYNVTFKVYEKYTASTTTNTYKAKFNFDGTNFVQVGDFVKQ